VGRQCAIQPEYEHRKSQVFQGARDKSLESGVGTSYDIGVTFCCGQANRAVSFNVVNRPQGAEIGHPLHFELWL
jgi:hypothetical protein